MKRHTMLLYMICTLALCIAIPAGVSAAQQAPQFFVLSDRCMACHNGLVTPDGTDVSIGMDWSASIMAHSAVDPYWRGSIRREAMDHPEAAAEIENECTTCHMPMAQRTAALQGGMGQAFANFAPAAPTQQTMLANNSVSCSVCHQILPDGLGTQESFTGGWTINTGLPMGYRKAFGPFEVQNGHKMLMRSAAKLTPNQGMHMQDAALCGSCHTLYTHTRGPDGEVVGTLPEQMPYLEWLHSDYADGGPRAKTCQQCHMPMLADPQPITSVLGQPREGFNRHVFRGGNFLGLEILETFAAEIGVTAPAAQLQDTRAATEQNLTTNSGVLTIPDASVQGAVLKAALHIENVTGHKLPTAYPSRRAWLHVTVLDGGGGVVFESGALRPDGAIAGNDNDADPARYEPHHTVIDSPETVQIYEAIMVGADDAVTTGLLTAIRYVKDNRLLPHGFDKAGAGPDIAVQGAAGDDPDFTAAGDTVQVAVDVSGAQGPFTLQAELVYQPVGFRWAQNLKGYEAAEPQQFVRMYDTLAHRSSIVLASANRTMD